jgi:hypothetical protein
MMVRYELRKIYQHMNRDERRKLAQTWGVTRAFCLYRDPLTILFCLDICDNMRYYIIKP